MAQIVTDQKGKAEHFNTYFRSVFSGSVAHVPNGTMCNPCDAFSVSYFGVFSSSLQNNLWTRWSTKCISLKVLDMVQIFCVTFFLCLIAVKRYSVDDNAASNHVVIRRPLALVPYLRKATFVTSKLSSYIPNFIVVHTNRAYYCHLNYKFFWSAYNPDRFSAWLSRGIFGTDAINYNNSLICT